MALRKLDVGCGAAPKGDVNVDIFTGYSPHTGDQLHTETFQRIEPKQIRNFVKADGNHLPFKDGSFEEVYSSQVIEHTTNPFLFLRELSRVAKASGTVQVQCPHRFARGRKELTRHISKLDESWFRTASKELGLEILALNVKWMPIGFRIGFFHVRPFAKPWEIDVTMRKSSL